MPPGNRTWICYTQISGRNADTGRIAPLFEEEIPFFQDNERVNLHDVKSNYDKFWPFSNSAVRKFQMRVPGPWVSPH